MICSNCGKAGIYWKNLGGPRVLSPPYTYCPHCGGKNCQKFEEPEEHGGERCQNNGGKVKWKL